MNLLCLLGDMFMLYAAINILGRGKGITSVESEVTNSMKQEVKQGSLMTLKFNDPTDESTHLNKGTTL